MSSTKRTGKDFARVVLRETLFTRARLIRIIQYIGIITFILGGYLMVNRGLLVGIAPDWFTFVLEPLWLGLDIP